jgi:tetratricopeptide (TPR) repeat protein
MNQNEMWSGEVPLFERTLAHEPGLGRVRFLLGKAYVMQNRIPEALVEYSKGLQIMREYVRKTDQSKAGDFYRHYVKNAHFDRGVCYLAVGDIARANEEFQASLAVKMRYPVSSEIRSQDSVTQSNLGLNFIRLGNLAEAKRCFMRAVQLDSRNYQALSNLGSWYVAAGDRALARFLFEKALKVNPEFPVAWQNLKKLDDFGL